MTLLIYFGRWLLTCLHISLTPLFPRPPPPISITTQCSSVSSLLSHDQRMAVQLFHTVHGSSIRTHLYHDAKPMIEFTASPASRHPYWLKSYRCGDCESGSHFQQARSWERAYGEVFQVSDYSCCHKFTCTSQNARTSVRNVKPTKGLPACPESFPIIV